MALPDATAIGELGLARELRGALIRGLARGGVAVVACRSASAVLSTRLVWLRSSGLLVDPGRQVISGRSLQLGLELWLNEAGGETLWRSGLLEVEVLWALAPADPVRSEAARARSVQALARRAAEQALALLYSGGTGSPIYPARMTGENQLTAQ